MGANVKLFPVVFVDVPFQILTETLVWTIDRSFFQEWYSPTE